MPTEPVADVVRRARSLLGRHLTAHGVTVRITEVEAYGGIEDPASHAYTRTPRSEVMYGPPWRLYVYRSYGIHYCANIVTGPTDIGAAVLLRAGEVVDGLDLARERRGAGRGAGAVPDERLARGPGNLAQALGITLADLGTDVLAGGAIRLGPEVSHDRPVQAGPRVGVSKAADVPWRFWLAGEPSVSAYRRSPRALPGTAVLRPRG
ncbi:DNA-3-methyladenine glycosylase [Nocardioides sp. zg-536]|uniref:Putative 3-methyladenine DNA glycosylase n=1 Tax=Nocardioides faecalis TaxID=2803858 RepID=A0A938Y5B8_9ACTN|nr:DNA-3-methyladenine glycosylase [Nocardioides faecalis]MBM9459494.1 DNA-3-methyladenine glycosylase [Nocardioides faecalis]QVI59406.1 DNA-3-methyladenine glycosylase [Nocardioides faecalis]